MTDPPDASPLAPASRYRWPAPHTLTRTVPVLATCLLALLLTSSLLVPDRPASIRSPAPRTTGLLININHADAHTLQLLPQIGHATAQAIIDYRDRHGPFTSFEQLDSVPNIGPARLSAIRPYITLGDQPPRAR